MPDNEHDQYKVPLNDENMNEAAEELAAFIVDVIEASLERSGGQELHGPEATLKDLMEGAKGSNPLREYKDLK